jgi:transposase InsO family protein
VLATFRQTVAEHAIPASTLTDNEMVFTTRLSQGKKGAGTRNGFETELRRLNVDQKNGRPNHPTTQGMVERFQQTMNKWLRGQPDQPTSIDDLQALLDAFRRGVQRPPSPPLPRAPGHSRHDLHQPTQSDPEHRPPR